MPIYAAVTLPNKTKFSVAAINSYRLKGTFRETVKIIIDSNILTFGMLIQNSVTFSYLYILPISTFLSLRVLKLESFGFLSAITEIFNFFLFFFVMFEN